MKTEVLVYFALHRASGEGCTYLPKAPALKLSVIPASKVDLSNISAQLSTSFTIDVTASFLQEPQQKLGDMEVSPLLLAELFLRSYDEFRKAIEPLESAASTQKLSEVKGCPRWLSRARDIVHQRFGDQPKLSEIAAEVGVHPVHLAREFRRFYGSSVGEYLRAFRVQFACEKLLSSDDSAVKIAAAAGFADQSHFSRIFKRATGTTPGQYRTESKCFVNGTGANFAQNRLRRVNPRATPD